MVFNPLGENLALLWDIIAAVISIICVFMVVKINGAIQNSGKLSTTVTRKLVHIFAGPVFVVTWVLFSASFFTPFIVMFIPLLFVLQFIGVGTGKIKDEDFVNSMSRSGDPSELLKGPLYYAIIMVLMTVLWFYVPSTGVDSAIPTAFILIGCLSGGDGIADIVGRKYGGEKKFGIGGSEKTIIGSIAMFIGSFFVSFILILIFSIEIAIFNPLSLIIPIIIISLVATIVEALSPKSTDNWTIFLSVTFTVLVLSVFAPTIWPYNFLNF
jgi:dolichol kinase